MNINNLGLLNTIGSIINEGDTSPDFAIAKYILHNLNNLDDITVNEITDNSFVSRSSIRRFCKKLGYGNFSELKDSLTDIIFPSNIHLREFTAIDEYRESLTTGLGEMISDINQIMTDRKIKNIVEQIDSFDDIIFLSSNNTSSNLMKFQQELFYAQKVIRLINTNFDLKSIKNSSSADSLIFVVSVSGVFAQSINETLEVMEGKKILISANRNEQLTSPYDEIIYLSNQNIEEDGIGLLGKYGITYFFDLISEYYIYKYQKY